jgi:proteasome assembly chaperone (PAC2) family protein
MDVLDSMSVLIDFKGITSLNRFVSDQLVDKLMPVNFKTVRLCEDLESNIKIGERGKIDICNTQIYNKKTLN